MAGLPQVACFYVIAVVLLIGPEHTHGLVKKWYRNTNFENVENWNVGRLPCRNDVVKFPETAGTVYVQTNVTAQQIVLPINGELVLANYMSFSFPSFISGDANCAGQDVTYNGSTPWSWYDPESWCEAADVDASCMSETTPRLDTEYLPCETDQVVFSSGSGFVVDLESNVDLYMGRLTIRGKDYTTGTFRSYLTSGRGQQEFVRQSGRGATTVNIGGSLCRSPTGCPCGNDGGLLEQKVCDIQAARCPDIPCRGALLPHGHCCHICGSIMTLDYRPGFKYKGLENAIYNGIPRAARRSVRVVVSRLHGDQVQVVIQDLDGSRQVQTVVDAIKKKIQPDQGGNSRYKITKIAVKSDEGNDSPNSQAITGASKWMSGGSIASLVIAIIVIIAIIIIAMFCLMDRRRSPGERPRIPLPKMPTRLRRFFPDGTRDIELEPSVRFQDDLVMCPMPSETVRGFENPTYDSNSNVNSPSDGSNGAPINTIDLSEPTFIQSGQDTGFSNPMYGTNTKVEDLSYLDAGVKLNPIFSAEGLEDDSEI